ncbi:MAG: peptide deformylase [Gemmatimonadaceae bacterium]
MSILPIHVLGAPVLRAVTTPVAEITDGVRRLVDDMYETMYAAQGIGLAAPQVGRSERIAVVDVAGARHALINPSIVDESGGSERAEEGCLSIPEIYGDVERSARVIMRATNIDGNEFEVEASELLARCFQHEIDHLHGKLFIDYFSFLKKRAANAKWELQRSKYPNLLRMLTADDIRRLKAEHDDHPDERL